MFSFHERLGLFCAVEAGTLSTISSAGLLAYALYRWITLNRRSAPDASDSSLFLNLMLSDLIQAIGIFPSIRWMNDGMITEGAACTTQAVLKQIGINGSSWTSLAIAFQTFAVLVLRWRTPRYAGRIAVAGIWGIVALIVGINYGVGQSRGNRTGKNYYGDTGYWCWIDDEFGVERITSEYLWMWVAGGLMAILYGIMFLVMRGIITIGHRPNVIESDEEKKSKAIANLMLYYPAVYIFCIFPNSLSRWLVFQKKAVPSGYTLFASALFALSGVFNLILFLVTRPELVKGPRILSPDSEEHLALPVSPKRTHHHETRQSSNRLGHLPEMESPRGGQGHGHLPDVEEDGAYHEGHIFLTPASENGGFSHSTSSYRDSSYKEHE